VSAGRVVKTTRYEYPENIPVLRRMGRFGDGYPLDSEFYAVLKRAVPEEVKALEKRIGLNINIKRDEAGAGNP